MQIPPPIAPIVKGREQKDPGGLALSGASRSDSNPNKHHAPTKPAQYDIADEAKAQESQASRLIDRSPISSETQAALLALLSEPFTATEGGDKFAELVEEATLEQSAAGDSIESIPDSTEAQE